MLILAQLHGILRLSTWYLLTSFSRPYPARLGTRYRYIGFPVLLMSVLNRRDDFISLTTMGLIDDLNNPVHS